MSIRCKSRHHVVAYPTIFHNILERMMTIHGLFKVFQSGNCVLNYINHIIQLWWFSNYIPTIFHNILEIDGFPILLKHAPFSGWEFRISHDEFRLGISKRQVWWQFTSHHIHLTYISKCVCIYIYICDKIYIICIYVYTYPMRVSV